jgi:uncharacterized repeat protein (TIGR01451 family)
MKKILLIASVVFNSLTLSAQMVYIPDPIFRSYLYSAVPNAMVGDSLNTMDPQVAGVTQMGVCCDVIASLEGVQYFINLNILDCGSNQLTSLPSPLPSTLQHLYCYSNFLTSLPSLPAGLLELDCGYNPLGSLPALPGNLTKLTCEENQLTSLPLLPSTLTELICINNQITSLPAALPPLLTNLSCSDNSLTSIPTLPSGLVNFDCENNSILSLPALPSTLNELSCGENPITALPSLPALVFLDCHSCLLTSLPALPSNISELHASSNMLTSLPALPVNLNLLDVSNNNLTSLPPLPADLNQFWCENNQLNSLPELPAQIGELYCSNNNLTALPPLSYTFMYHLECTNNQINCLPLLPNTLEDFYITGNYISCLPNMPANYQSSDTLPPFCNIYNTTCSIYPQITGNIFDDQNQNGIPDVGEPPIVNQNISGQPGNFLAHSVVTGAYNMPVDTSVNYTVEFQLTGCLYCTPTTPISQSAYFTAMGQVDSLNNFGVYLTPNINDLSADIVSEVEGVRPGLTHEEIITVKNTGTTVQSPIVELNFDPLLTIVSSNPPYSSLNNFTATWNLPSMPLFEQTDIHIQFMLSTSANIGDSVYNTVCVSPVANDFVPQDNCGFVRKTVVNSCDPNSKEVSHSTLTTAQVASGLPLTYTIRFQNTGTAPAINIHVSDTLSSFLDVSTFEFITSSYPCTWNISNGVISFIFLNINLADSNSNEPFSHGMISYRIRPISNLALGNQIVNTANIFFDFNQPVITNAAVTDITPVSVDELSSDLVSWMIYPNPALLNAKLLLNSKTNQHDVALKVFDVSGRLMDNKTAIELKAGINEINIERNGLAGGIYFLELTGHDRILIRGKISWK